MEDSSRVIADVQIMVKSLGQLPEPRAEPALIVVSGLPGTGKSYFCRSLADRLHSPVLESDALRRLLFPSPSYSAAESAYLFRTIHSLIEGLLRKGIPLILDATNLSERHRERLYNIAEQTNSRLVLARTEAPPDVVQERLRSRLEKKETEDKSDAGWAVYQKLKLTVDKIRRHHYVVDTSGDITPVLDRIVREVNR